MRLYLVRHTTASPGEDDAARPLSKEGRKEARSLAEFFLKNRAFSPDRLWISPLLRAKETAKILSEGLQPAPQEFEVEGLRPDADPKAIVTKIALLPPGSSLALVGHNPHLSILATLLVRGRPHPISFPFEKGTVLALEHIEPFRLKPGDPEWAVEWQISPDLLR
jgi:phosphohistidine phosphatase